MAVASRATGGLWEHQRRAVEAARSYPAAFPLAGGRAELGDRLGGRRFRCRPHGTRAGAQPGGCRPCTASAGQPVEWQTISHSVATGTRLFYGTPVGKSFSSRGYDPTTPGVAPREETSSARPNDAPNWTRRRPARDRVDALRLGRPGAVTNTGAPRGSCVRPLPAASAEQRRVADGGTDGRRARGAHPMRSCGPRARAPSRRA
jgi:hypothetical protein